VPDALYDELRRQELPISALAQEAFHHALDARNNASWITAARSRRPRTTTRIDTSAVLDEVRDEFGA
jgi:post-segregation antitoxin (ccd killing protein)